MFDNQLPQTIRKWKEIVPAHVKVEASGGISFSTIASFKGCGADFLSMGELTNEVEPLDISFLVKNAVKAEFKKKTKRRFAYLASPLFVLQFVFQFVLIKNI
nr:hypothetical protein [Ligilactobacillus ruminis]